MDKRFVLIYRTADGSVHYQFLDADVIGEAFQEAEAVVLPATELYPDLPLDILGVIDEVMVPVGQYVIDPHVSLI